jgi:tRNA (mo5U34)-methyltransferase
VFGIHIDTEWRSDWKWNRLKDHIAPLADRTVLDVGCGSGYHCWRMAGEGARLTIGIDPTLLYVMQFAAIQRLANQDHVHVLPLGIDDLPQGLSGFDTVFSMGVLYHRRSPIDHLFELKSLLRPRGELILETLVIEGEAGRVMVPADRYAQMRNVWFLPSSETLVAWLQRCGYEDVRVVDVNRTSLEEQRSTDWMRFNSLADFLMPEHPELTVEGLPAPTRAVIVAQTPS